MKEKIQNLFHRYPALTAAGLTLFIGLALFFVMHHGKEEEEVVPEDIVVNDTLALNIICMPTLESLPLYHALEAGWCDSVGLQLGIHTELSQFDVDSIMRRTKRIDGAVFDNHRLEHYRSAHKTMKVTECIPLQGKWALVTSGKLRIREVSKLKKRVVASSRFSTSSHLLENSLRGSGLKITDLYHAQINDFSLRSLMLDESQVDASLLPEPYASAALLRGHRVVWRNDSVASQILCFRNKAFANKRKEVQIKLLRRAYGLAVRDLNAHGIHAADSALMKAYGLSSETIDTLSLPHYRIPK